MIEIIAQTKTRERVLGDCALPQGHSRSDTHVAPDEGRSGGALHDCKLPWPERQPDEAPLGALRPHPLLRLIPLEAGYAVAFVPSFSQVAVLSSQAQELLASLPLPPQGLSEEAATALRALLRLGLVTADDGKLPRPAPPDVLIVWLHITNACNLRCTYCYIHKSAETMSETTARAAIDAAIRAARQHGYKSVAIKYAGGEATLRLALIERAHRYALEQAAAHGLQLEGGVLSNGTGLSPRKLELIRRLNLRLMISLDGLGESHDAQRPTVGGEASSEAARRGIEQALAAGLAPEIAITVTGQSVAGLPDLLRWLLARGLRFSINFYREHDCSASFAELQLEEHELVEGMRRAYQVVEEQMPPWSLLGALIDRADLSAPHQRTCAVGENYLVIDHHGRIAKCQMTLSQPIALVSDANPLALLRADRRGVQNLPVDQKEGCSSCEWRYWCAGGCPIATHRATGRYDLRSPNCGIYQRLYPEVLRLEGLRLLQRQRSTPWGQGAQTPPAAALAAAHSAREQA